MPTRRVQATFASALSSAGVWTQGHTFCAMIVLLAAGALGCAHDRECCGRSHVDEMVNCRTAYTLGPSGCSDELFFPNGASFDDGLNEDEAVLIALWNNALFHEILTEIGIAQGDLVQAGLLPNPEIAYFVPMSDKPYKYLLDFPVESLWLRPIRIAAAEREACRVSERVTQAALDLIRDTRQAYANVLLAQDRIGIAQEAVRIRTLIAKQANARLDAGDVSVQESATAKIDADAATQDLVRLEFDVKLAKERLRLLLGLGGSRPLLKLDPTMRAPLVELDADSLSEDAAVTRPDARAADQNVAAFAERLRLSKVSWIRFLGIADATSGTKTGHELGPAIRVTLPVFNWNEGAIARAEAELDRAIRQRQTVANQIRLDVHQAHLRYDQARKELEILESSVLPEAEAAIDRAEAAYREGDTPYVVVLQTTRQLLDSHNRRAQLNADIRVAWADLERSVGRRLDDSAAIADTPPIPAD